MDEEIELKGGVANAGAVVRSGDHVLRPSSEHSAAVHRLLHHLHAAGFGGAPVPVGVDDDGRERLGFIDGEVPLPPYPDWAQSDDALASVTRLLRSFHEAARSFAVDPADRWSREMADPAGGAIVCHNDVCLENVVFRDGAAVALLDFDFAAPGRPVFDIAAFARMCVPVDDESCERRFGWKPADRPSRLRLVADTYRLDPSERRHLVRLLDESIERGGEFVARKVEAGDPNFIAMWESMGGISRFDRRRDWWSEARVAFDAALR